MRKVLLCVLLTGLLMLAIVVAIGLGVHWAGSLDGVRMSVDGDTIEGPAIAALLGGGVLVGTVVVCLIVFAILASVAIVVPIVLIGVAIALLCTIFVGLAPLAIPVLLVMGAYVLLSRRAKRKAVRDMTPYPPSTPAI